MNQTNIFLFDQIIIKIYGFVNSFHNKNHPFQAGFGIYLVFSIIIIVLNYNKIPEAIFLIISSAFNPKAFTGGAVGSILTTVITGASRGIFSNEAGLGTSVFEKMSTISMLKVRERGQGRPECRKPVLFPKIVF